MLRKWYDTYLFNLAPEWRDNHANWTKFYLAQDPEADGVFQDESGGYINSTLYAHYMVNEKQTIIEVISEGHTYKFIQTNYPIFAGEAFPTVVSNISDSDIIGIWAEVGMIFLKETAPAAGTPVTVSYYNDATIPQDIKDNWKGSMSGVLSTIREAIGGKLFLFK